MNPKQTKSTKPISKTPAPAPKVASSPAAKPGRTGDPRTCPLCLAAPAERAACWHGRTR